ncbi:Protein of unknown function [Bacillus mycoides]|nr:Protein of unknown function [Bacillus mycoides]
MEQYKLVLEGSKQLK